MQRSNPPALDGTIRGRHLEVDLAGVPRGHAAAELIAQVRDALRSGRLPTGTRLPATRSLAADLGVSRGVVVRAYEQLVAEGYLAAHQGRGTEVVAVPGAPRTAPRPALQPSRNPGLPPGSLFPRAAWLRAASRALDALPDADLGYGDPAGLPRLRMELAAYLGRVRAVTAPAERIAVVNGFAQGVALLARVLQDQGIDRVAMEDPGSAGLRDQLQRVGVRPEPVRVDEEGLQVDDLRATGLRVVVVTPAHQFPTGVVMSPRRRHELVAWARETGGLVVEDDYDAEFRYDRSPVGSLQGLAPDLVAYGGSVSKTLAPGIRVGWLVLPESLVTPLAEAKYTSDLGTSVWTQATLAEFIASGDLDRHLRRAAAEYRRRRNHLVDQLAANLPDWRTSGTAAGLHLLARLPVDADEEATASAAQDCGLDARPLGRYAVEPLQYPALVIGYGHQGTATLGRAVRELADRQ